MNVVTVRWGKKFSTDYVTALKHQIPRLKVLTDEDGTLREPRRFVGWFSKLEIFRPENRDLRPCLVIDLDTYIMGSLAPFHRLDETKLWMIRDFNNKRKSNSGLFIAPKDGVSDTIWASIEMHYAYKGDGDFMAVFDHEILQNHVSGIMSYKTDKLQEHPGDARIICFHGRPKPHETDGWASDRWLECMKA